MYTTLFIRTLRPPKPRAHKWLYRPQLRNLNRGATNWLNNGPNWRPNRDLGPFLMIFLLSFQLICQKHTSDLESLSSVITISPVVTSALLHIINCEHSIRSKNILICFRRTGRVRFFRHRPTAKLDIFSSTFLDSYQIVFSSSSAIFGLFFPSITSFHAYQSDIRVHKDLRCQIWICHKKERYFLRIIRPRT